MHAVVVTVELEAPAGVTVLTIVTVQVTSNPAPVGKSGGLHWLTTGGATAAATVTRGVGVTSAATDAELVWLVAAGMTGVVSAEASAAVGVSDGAGSANGATTGLGAVLTAAELSTGAFAAASVGAAEGVVAGAAAFTDAGVDTALGTTRGSGVGTDADMSTGATGGRSVAPRGRSEAGSAIAGAVDGESLSPKAVSRRAPHANTRKTERSSAPARTAPLVGVDPGRLAGDAGASSGFVTDSVMTASSRAGCDRGVTDM